MNRSFLIVCALLLGCAKQRVQFNTPVGDRIVFHQKDIQIDIPDVRDLKRGHYPVEFRVSRDHARDLGLEDAFTLYGYLDVGRPTENSSLTNVVLEIPDNLILAATTQGRVLETVVYDDGAGGQILVSLKLGDRRPAKW